MSRCDRRRAGAYRAGVIATEGLRPCPLCGGRAQMERGVTGIVAVCCPCSSHVFFGGEYEPETTRLMWNRRAACPPERRKK